MVAETGREGQANAAGGPPPLLELRGVTKVYGEGEAAVHALRGVDLSIEPGEFVAILGTSGCGKSTAMNILGCLDSPSGGEYRMEGVSVGALPPDVLAALRNRRFGFIFQGFNLLSRTSAIDNVELPLIYAGVARPDEPTGNLDSHTGAEIMALLTRLSRELGLTIIMVTHDHEIAAYARRHVVFRDGAVLSDTVREEAPR